MISQEMRKRIFWFHSLNQTEKKNERDIRAIFKIMEQNPELYYVQTTIKGVR